MKKTKLLAALCLSAYMGFAQNQQLAVPPNNINLNSGNPVGTAISGASSATSGATNGAYDANGKLLFYIENLNVFIPGNSTSVGHLPMPYSPATGSGGPEVEIVPIPGKELCNKFYVIYTCPNQAANGSGLGALCYCEIDYNGSTSTIIPTSATKLSSPNLLMWNYAAVSGGLAVSDQTTSNNRYLFLLATANENDATQGGLYRFTISGTGISATPVLLATNATLNKYYQQAPANFAQTSQLTLSTDQTHLAWCGGTGIAFASTTQSVFEIQLLSDYTFSSGTYMKYSLGSGGADYFVAGITYDQSNKLYASTQSGIYSQSYSGGSFTLIPNSKKLTFNSSSGVTGSQLQYVQASGLIIGAAPTANNAAGTLFSIDPNNSLALNSSYLNSSLIHSVWNGGYTLPDQIDGDMITYVNIVPSITASNVCAGNFITANTGYAGNLAPNAYYLEVDAVTDANGSNPTKIWSNWYLGALPNPLKIPGSNTLTCGHYYNIGLAVADTTVCFPWGPTSTVVYVNCNPAPIITGPNNICLGQSQGVTLSENYPTTGNTINWYIQNDQGQTHLTSGTTSITENPTASNVTYGVTVTNSANCSGSATQLVNVWQNNPSFSLTENASNTNPLFGTFTAKVTSSSSTTSAPGFSYQYTVEELSSTGAVNWTTQASPATNPPAWQSLTNNTFCGIDNHGNDYGTGGYIVPYASISTCSGSYGMFKPNIPYSITLTTWNSYCPAKPYTYPTTNLTGGREMQTTSIDNLVIDASKQLLIYPNPSNGSFTVETSETSPQLLQVFDLTGRLVISQTLNGTATIEGTTLIDGVYNVKISNNTNVVNKRIVIAK